MCLEVLIADQDFALAELYCRFLAADGFAARRVRSARECLEMASEEAPGVFVIDLELSWSDEVLAGLGARGLLPAVILTTWSDSPTMPRSRPIPPVVLCLRKFFPLPMLREGIRFAFRTLEARDTLRAAT
jgi:FixJ family two-component response regulator